MGCWVLYIQYIDTRELPGVLVEGGLNKGLHTTGSDMGQTGFIHIYSAGFL